MRAIEFMKERNILYYWVFVELETNEHGKIKKRYINFHNDAYQYPDEKRSSTYFMDRQDIIRKQMKYYDDHHQDLKGIADDNAWELMLSIDTYHIHQIDIDDASFEEELEHLKTKLPWYKSVSKGLPHFFFTTDFKFQGKSCTHYEDGCFDILHGNGSLIYPDTIIENSDKPFEFPNFRSFIQDYIISSPPTRRIVDKDNQITYTDTIDNEALGVLIDMLDDKRAVEYKSWITIGMAIKYNDPENGLEIFRKFSQKCPEKYDRIECERKWDQFKPNGTVTLGTIYYYARQDDPENYERFFGKTYARVKKQFERTRFKVLDPVGYCEINEFHDDGIIFRDESKMTQTYRNLGCYILDKKEPYKKFIKLWMNDEYIRTYQKLTFEPHPYFNTPQNNPNVYNTFNGFEIYRRCGSQFIYDPVKGQAGLQLFQQHLRYLCGEEKTEEVFHYNTRHFAHLFQKPQQKMIVALVFKSKQGVGKNICFDTIGLCLLGEALYYLTENYNDLFGTFNPLIKNKLLLVYDEASGKDTFENAESLKARITGTKVTINKKNISQESCRDYSRLVFLSNNLTPIKKEEDDRRYFCTRCSDKMAKNTPYFNELETILDFKNDYQNACLHTLWAIFQWFMSIDISNFDPINDRPKTSYNEQMTSIAPLLLFFVARFQANKKQTIQHTKQELYDLYREWAREKMPNSKQEQYNPFCKKLHQYPFIKIWGRDYRKITVEFDKMIEEHPHLSSMFCDDPDDPDDEDDNENDDEDN